MRIGLIGYGGVGKAFTKLIVDKSLMLKEEGLNIEIIYIINSKGGIYNPKGIDYDKLLALLNEGKSIIEDNFDVEGWGTAFKLLILTNVIMKEEKSLSDIKIDGITNLKLYDIESALKEGKRYKLIGRTSRSGKELNMLVRLEKVDKEHPFYNVDSKNKAVRYISDTLGELTLIGGASGTTAAAASILRDIIYINRVAGV